MTHRKPKFMNISEICEQFHGGRTWVYERIQQGLMPKPVSLGPRMSRWPFVEIEAVWKAYTAGADDEEIRKLIAELHALRVAAAKQSVLA